MATRTARYIEQESLPQATLYLAFELGKNTWKLGFTVGVAQQPRERMIPAGEIERLQQEVARAKQRFGLPEEARVVSCYEAGRDGFWLHRLLESRGICTHVIDPASLQVDRRARRAKTDRVDAERLLRSLMAYLRGEAKVWSVVRVPTLAEEDDRRLHRERDRRITERIQHVNRIKGLCALQWHL